MGRKLEKPIRKLIFLQGDEMGRFTVGKLILKLEKLQKSLIFC